MGQGDFASKMKCVPKIRLNFVLNEFKVTLLNELGSGLQNYTSGFAVSVYMYDGTNKYNRHTMEIEMSLKDFGVDVLSQNKMIPFLQQLDSAEAS